MPFRFSSQPPKSLGELFERLRDLLPQLDPVVLHNIQVNTTITTVAHGQKSTPKMWKPGAPHCLAIVAEAAPMDSKNIYLRASNKCVVDIEVIR
jgi:hypothetical protein